MGHMNDTLCPNIWVPENDFPCFRDFMETSFTLCFEVQTKIFHALQLVSVSTKNSLTHHMTREIMN